MKKLFFTLLLLIAFPVVASHIVGGEFELLHLTGNSYQLNLIIYFDLNNGNEGAKDPSADVSIYRKSDNQLMATQRLPRISETVVSYTQPACSKGEIRTSKLIYSSQITLDPATYNDPAGYYVSWQRCCRNYSITNIYSQVPGTGISAGQTFYLEFPAVVKDGKQFIDSTPKLFPPLNDFAVLNRPYYVDFSGTDDDGDSLVYSMVTPLDTKSAVALPAASPRPYPEVTWRAGYSLTNITKGNPDLRISKDGLLTGTPGSAGLFVFAVKVEEYRNKEKIGESRRDFQMLVLDIPTGVPPKITGKKLTDATTYSKNMSVSFSNTVTDGNRCIQVSVSDDDSKQASDNFQENITIKVVALNFKNSKLNSILPAVTTAILKNGSTQDFSICFPQCPYIKGPYQIGIIAYDDACSLPLMDTLKVVVNTEPPFNTPPYFVTPSQAIINQTLKEGDAASWPFEIVDDQQDEIIASILTNGFVLATAGMKYTVTEKSKGLVKGVFSWDAYCDIYDFTKRTDFQVTLQADDNDVCKVDLPVKKIFNLSVTLPPVDSPVILTDLVKTKTRTITGVQRHVNESLNFTVFASELTDQSTIDLKLVDNATYAPYGISFANASGKKNVASTFQWNILCAKVDPAKRSAFVFRFIASDNTNKCKFNKADTVDVEVKILPPLNNKPTVALASLNSIPLTNGTMDITLGQSILLNVAGNDIDKDNIKLKLVQADGNVKPVGYTFADAAGKASVTQPFSWTPDCSIFENGIYKNNYTFKFKLTDDQCYSSKSDSTVIKINVKDIDDLDTAFLPANVITPNGDGCNDYFAMEGFDSETCNGVNIDGTTSDSKVSLPLDNCLSQFQSIRIYNRWGGEVFKSNDRKFKWHALDDAAGVYYFTLKYTNREYKGTVSVRN
jgi:hypothetical protein